MSSQREQTAQAILDAIGGAENIASFSHCATRLRFELNDASMADKKALDAIPKVMGAVPQGGNHYQVVIGGDVATVYDDMNSLPAMKGAGSRVKSDADVKAEARAKTKGKLPWMDAFFEYLSDSFRPILGVLLGASLIIAFTAVLDALEIVDFRATDKAISWIFVDAMWRSVFYFLPVMVAYNAGKKLRIDPWVTGSIMFALLTPEFLSLAENAATTCVTNDALGTETCKATIFGLPMLLQGYGGNVFVPLIMAAIAALCYKFFQKIIPSAVHMVFVPFLTLVVMIPLTAFLIGPFGVWLGNEIGIGLSWMNSNAPFVFAILIPMLYPFLVPLGLHWPLNALMLVNIQTLGYDFIQGPMGAWNFACFGATAAVLVLSLKDHDPEMRQTSASALAAGLLGGISEPSLYGIHLRFKRIYPRMLVGCFTGGLTIAILGMASDGVKTGAFVFTSLLTIPVFSPMLTYVIAIAVAFFTAFILILITDYRTPEEKAEALARAAAARDADGESEQFGEEAPVAAATAAGAAGGVATLTKTRTLAAPVAGDMVAVAEVSDAVFASGALGEGVGIKPAESTVVSPIEGTVVTAMKTGHAYGLKTEDGVEVLVHIGIDTVKMKGEGFKQLVQKGDRVTVGQPLAEVDFTAVDKAGYDPTVIMTVTNTKKLGAVQPAAAGKVAAGDTVVTVES
ncbi:glucose PTS transporter subunit IIA [Corynebacterium sp. H128]|uniref:glucose PTS transporter subunit IIA n=1 Tax=unclassified Corynebacterium TaxID=2624378 RepID=UPI0030B64E1B